MKIKIFKGKSKSVENDINSFLSPKEDGESISVRKITQCTYETLDGDDGVIVTILYKTRKPPTKPEESTIFKTEC